MLVEFLERLRDAVLLEVVGGGIEVVVHGEQLALDEVRLGRPPQPHGDIRLAHGEIEFAVVEQQGDVDLRIDLGEFLEARRQPHGAKAHGRGDAQLARRLLLRVHQARLGGGELGEHFVRRAIQHLALLGEDEAARMAVEEGHVQRIFQRRDLAADSRLRQAQLVACMGEAAGIRHGVEDPELVPVHDRITQRHGAPPSGCAASARPRVRPCSPCRRR